MDKWRPLRSREVGQTARRVSCGWSVAGSSSVTSPFSVCPNPQLAVDIVTKVAIAHAPGSKESLYATRDKLLEEHGIAVHARRAKKVVKAVDSAGCVNGAMGTFSEDGAGWSESSPATVFL